MFVRRPDSELVAVILKPTRSTRQEATLTFGYAVTFTLPPWESRGNFPGGGICDALLVGERNKDLEQTKT